MLFLRKPRTVQLHGGVVGDGGRPGRLPLGDDFLGVSVVAGARIKLLFGGDHRMDGRAGLLAAIQ
ncbi:Uncharacterised protein [Mycobacteroides abscessus subsp. abscessus]|nr:Uncharacterised protein [Mycobacteroides abscessus subsp. abscessus]SKV04984.1 Uncharacterised protein [Mycobacteroides abscessus subsp. abscessus]